MVGQSAEIIGVSAVDRAIGLCSGDKDCVDSGTATCDSPQASSTPRALFRKHDLDVTRLEELVRRSVSVRSAGETVDRDDARDDRWPESLALEGRD
jgi:hypothetical protein